MTPKDIDVIVTAIREPLREELAQEIAGRIEQFRRAVYVRDEWCCNTLTRFAVEVWEAPKPKPDTGHIGSVSYQLRGRSVNYCPFCGVSFLAPKATAK